jgi:hypothetical protein
MKKNPLLALSMLFLVSACSNGAVSNQISSTQVITQQSEQSTQALLPGLKSYVDDSNGITFDYPSNIQVQRSGDSIVAKHSVPFVHSAPCDFIGTGKELTELSDFDVSFEVYNKSLRDTAIDSQDASFAVDNMSGDEMKLSEGFIDSITVEGLKGYKLTQGVEGCGQYVYYFPLGNDATLVVSRAFVPELNSSISEDIRLKAEKLPNVILSQKSDEIFESILRSFRYIPAQ